MTDEQLERKRKTNREYMARLRAVNPERERQRVQDWFANNRDKKKQYDKKYIERVRADPERSERYHQKRAEIHTRNIDSVRQSSRKWAARFRKEKPFESASAKISYELAKSWRVAKAEVPKDLVHSLTFVRLIRRELKRAVD